MNWDIEVGLSTRRMSRNVSLSILSSKGRRGVGVVEDLSGLLR